MRVNIDKDFEKICQLSKENLAKLNDTLGSMEYISEMEEEIFKQDKEDEKLYNKHLDYGKKFNNLKRQFRNNVKGRKTRKTEEQIRDEITKLQYEAVKFLHDNRKSIQRHLDRLNEEIRKRNEEIFIYRNTPEYKARKEEQRIEHERVRNIIKNYVEEQKEKQKYDETGELHLNMLEMMKLTH
jgi:acyl-CoA reductase-like NAD-dependent aldehyde dehydrogenase